MEKLRTARNTEQARGAMGREEGEREFKMLLIDVVRGHDVSRFLSVVGCH